MPPFGQPQPQPEVQPQPKISAAFKRWRNLSNWQFRSLFFAIGLTTSNFARPYPSYFWLYVLAVFFGGLALMFFSPGDEDDQGLWRSGGTTLWVGALLAWWDLLKFLPWWSFVGALGVLVLLASAIGAIGGSGS